MNYFLEYEKLRNLHELYEDARDLCVSFGTPIENFAEADAKWKEVMSEAFKKVSGGIVSKEIASNIFMCSCEKIVPMKYLGGTHSDESLKKYFKRKKCN